MLLCYCISYCQEKNSKFIFESLFSNIAMILRRRLLFRTFNDPLERAWIIYNETLKWDLNLAIADYFWQVFSLSFSLSSTMQRCYKQLEIKPTMVDKHAFEPCNHPVIMSWASYLLATVCLIYNCDAVMLQKLLHAQKKKKWKEITTKILLSVWFNFQNLGSFSKANPNILTLTCTKLKRTKQSVERRRERERLDIFLSFGEHEVALQPRVLRPAIYIISRAETMKITLL